MRNEQKKRLPRGLKPTPQSEIDAAIKLIAEENIILPSSYLLWPIKMSYWGNNHYKDCVSAEEAFAKSCADPHLFIPDDTLIGWARRYSYLNGATLPSVMTTMNKEGIEFNLSTVLDGAYSYVNFKSSADLQNAICNFGPVKIGIGSEFLDTGRSPVIGKVTSGESGWTLYNYPAVKAQDHCVSICGYGNLNDLIAKFKEYGVNVKTQKGMPETLCYAIFTWNSIGIIDEQSMLNMTFEAWIRNPVTQNLDFQKVSGFKLKNDGGFVVDIHALYRDQSSITIHEAKNRENFPIDQSKTMDLAKKCTEPAINNGDFVQIKVWVESGKDNTCPIIFVYDPNGPTLSFKISGSTDNNSLEYLGPC